MTEWWWKNCLRIRNKILGVVFNSSGPHGRRAAFLKSKLAF
jgi:hypothetical protein